MKNLLAADSYKARKNRKAMENYYRHRDEINARRRTPCRVCGATAKMGYCPTHLAEHQNEQKIKDKLYMVAYNSAYQKRKKIEHAERQRRYLQTEKGQLASQRQSAKLAIVRKAKTKLRAYLKDFPEGRTKREIQMIISGKHKDWT